MIEGLKLLLMAAVAYACLGCGITDQIDLAGKATPAARQTAGTLDQDCPFEGPSCWLIKGGSYVYQQGVRIGRDGLLAALDVRLEPGTAYRVRLHYGEPWIDDPGAEHVATVEPAGSGWTRIDLAPSAIDVIAGEYVTIEISLAAGSREGWVYAAPWYTPPPPGREEWYQPGMLWFSGPNCPSGPGPLGCPVSGQTFDAAFRLWSRSSGELLDGPFIDTIPAAVGH